MIFDNLPALLVVLPLLGAPLCLLLSRGRPAWLAATLVSWLVLAISIALLWQVRAGGELHYAFGDWAPPWGIDYVVDRLAAYVLLIVAAIAAVVLPYSWRSVRRELPTRLHGIFYTLLLLCLAGLLGIVITGDAFNLFVLLEISSLSTYALISLGRDRRALTAAYQYLIMGTIGATFYIIGVGLLYMLTGTLNMADMAARMAAMEGSNTLHTAFAFIVVGLALKLAMFPLHLWLPNAYAFAPSVVTAFLAATATKVALYAMIRFIYNVFGPAFTFGEMHVQLLVLPLAAAGVFVGSVVAVFQHGLKRMLAYSSVAQIGYMLLGIGAMSVTGLTAALLHLFNHALMKGALFLAVGALVYRLGGSRLQDIAGIARDMPWTMAAFVIGGLSLIGVPGTVGFISKWYLILAALENGWWPVVVLVLVTSLVAVVYIWRVVETAYFGVRPADAAPVREAPLALLVPTWLLVAANLYFGIATGLTVGLAGDIAAGLGAGLGAGGGAP
ncbi:monovalent cation/H+ antiporter subunit D family protein [uncultured Thiohalocapsa sp.]|uniref:monovalent cation/H+ antiporter subunit D family protein n=1 Tax=uncultured Thiohalocapsa sp. TaxID=768990 RepID=UPI0025D25C13|nr:monovalent cation/H+ antiporter subunit D family protein [uncultured Thiohalocapsa sp.]